MKIVVSKPLVGFNEPEKGTIAIVSKAYSSEKSSTETSKPSSSSNQAELITNSKENELKSTRAQMVEVKEENKRLKSLLARIMEDYKSLQSQLMNEPQGESEKSGAETSSTTTVPDQETLKEEEADDHVSLSLGTSSNVQRKGEKNKGNRTSDKTMKDDDNDVNMNTGLTLGFDCKPERSNSSVAEDHQNQKEQKEEEIGDQPWTPSKILKVVDHRLCADEVSQHIHVKKARVSVRARCDGPTMIDGCQWRKYGQKISKGNPCPRAYYRCTVAPSCPVRKQVQRCADDTSILITTYEGTHDHPLPRAATAMASTTSAAANMIVSGSSATHPSITSPTLMAPINALTFKSNPNPIQPYLSSITASPHYPTITLDLTSPPSNPSPPKPITTQINRFSNSQPRFMFSSSSSLDSISPPTTTSPWGVNGYLGFGSNQTYHNNNNNNNRISNFSQQQSSLFLQKPNVDQRSTSDNLTDTIAKAITTDPSFQSALATAITSFVSNRKDGGGNDHQSLGQNLKWGSSVNNLSSGGFLDRIGGGGGSDANLPKGSMIFHQSSNGFSNGKISSGLSVEKKEQRS